MRQPSAWVAAVLLLVAAVLLVTGVGAAGWWIGVITIGIALVAVDAHRHRRARPHV